MSSEDKKLDVDNYKDEIASFKRVYIQLTELQKWLLNTSLASLAFAITVMLKTKNDFGVPSDTIALKTISLLFVSVICGLMIRFVFEMGSLVADYQIFSKSFPVLRNKLESVQEISKNSKFKLSKLLDFAINFNEKNFKEHEIRFPWFEITLIALDFIFLFSGILLLCYYVWRNLFG